MFCTNTLDQFKYQVLPLLIIRLSTEVVLGGLLGAGTGAGSCAAAPYRSSSVYWTGGCPAYAECCTEFGYCHSRVRFHKDP